jgi:hypothetical protein
MTTLINSLKPGPGAQLIRLPNRAASHRAACGSNPSRIAAELSRQFAQRIWSGTFRNTCKSAVAKTRSVSRVSRRSSQEQQRPYKLLTIGSDPDIRWRRLPVLIEVASMNLRHRWRDLVGHRQQAIGNIFSGTFAGRCRRRIRHGCDASRIDRSGPAMIAP